MSPDVSIIIITYNSEGSIGECLRSTAREFPNSETIVVDNSSRDDTRTIVQTFHRTARLICNPVNVGFAAAVNQAAKHASGSWFLLLNPDARLESGFGREFASVREQFPDAGVIGCQLMNSPGNFQPSVWKELDLRTLLFEAFLPYEASLSLITEGVGPTREVMAVSGACMAIRKDVFESNAGFDERFFLYYEDFDFCARVRRNGYTVMTAPVLKAFHQVRKSTTGNEQFFFDQIYLSKLRYYRIHENLLGALVAWFIITLGIAIRIPAYALVGIFSFNRKLLRLAKYHTFVLPKILASTMRKG